VPQQRPFVDDIAARRVDEGDCAARIAQKNASPIRPRVSAVAASRFDSKRRQGMLVVETIARIGVERFVKGKMIKEIARDLRISRNTFGSGETSFEYDGPPNRGRSLVDGPLISTSCWKAAVAYGGAEKLRRSCST
jgi:hypothetical protein